MNLYVIEAERPQEDKTLIDAADLRRKEDNGHEENRW